MMIKGPIGKILPPETEGTGLPGHPLDQLRLPTLDERANLFLRAVHGEDDFTHEDFVTARDRILDEMANTISPRSGGRSGDSNLPRLPEGDFEPLSVAASPFRLPDEYLHEFRSSPEIPVDPAGYPPTVIRALRDDAPSSRANMGAYSPREGTEFDASLTSIALSRIDSRRQAAKSGRQHVARRRLFIGVAAIAATVLLVAGVHRLFWMSSDYASFKSRVADQTLLPAPIWPTQQGAASTQSESNVAMQTRPAPVWPTQQGFASTQSESNVAMQTLPPAPVSPPQQGPVSTLTPQTLPPTAVRPKAQQGPVPVNSALTRGPSTPTVPSAGPPRNVDAMVRSGLGLIASGKIPAARSVLKQAADANNAEAALALGMTYDPVELENLRVRDVVPEADAARRWYQKAKDLGLAEAQGRIDRLAAREGQAR